MFPLHPSAIRYSATDDGDRQGVVSCTAIRDKLGEGGCQTQIKGILTVKTRQCSVKKSHSCSAMDTVR